MSGKTFRVLVTGSRTWQDADRVEHVLGRLHNGWSNVGFRMILVHGACPEGVDAIADRWARKAGVEVERHPAQWKTYGKSAGFVRNTEMAQSKPFICYAFIRNGSRGATHCMDEAIKANVVTWAFREEGVDGPTA